MEKSITTREDGTVVEVFTLKNTVTSEIKEAKAQGKSSVEVTVASGEAEAVPFNVPAGLLQSARANKMIGGYPDNTFRPQGKATRAEAVTVIIKLLR